LGGSLALAMTSHSRRSKGLIGPHSLDYAPVVDTRTQNGRVRTLCVIILILLALKLLFSVVYCEGIEVVVWGTPDSVGSTVGQRWSSTERAIRTFDRLPPYLAGVVVGLCLSDGYLRVVKGCKNALLQFNQSVKNSEYFWFVFRLLAPLIISWPKLYTHVRSGTVCSSLHLVTRALPCFTKLHSLFYVNGLKCIPDSSIIYHLLTPIALAHWLIGDGAWKGSGVIICTDSYTISDCVRLMNVLRLRYNLDCTLQISAGKHPRIYIPSRSVPLLRSIVLPYFHPSLYKKLGF